MPLFFYFYISLRDTDPACLAANRTPIIQADGYYLLAQFLCITRTEEALRIPSIKSFHSYPPLKFLLRNDAQSGEIIFRNTVTRVLICVA